MYMYICINICLHTHVYAFLYIYTYIYSYLYLYLCVWCGVKSCCLVYAAPSILDIQMFWSFLDGEIGTAGGPGEMITFWP